MMSRRTQREESFCTCVDSVSGADVSETAVLDRVVGSFDACPMGVHLV